MSKIIFTELEGWEEQYLKDSLPGHELVLLTRPLEEDDFAVLKDAQVLSPFIYTQVKAQELDKLPALKLVTTRSTGYDHVDVVEAVKRGIVVCNVPFYGENTVAEHAWALILALSRKICRAYERTEKGNFIIDASLRGFDLKGKTLGVVGGGHIGQHVIKYARAFEMNVLVYDPFPKEELARESGFTYTSLDALLKEADVVTLHAPLTDKTFHLLNAENMKLMKHGSILVNTARGGLIDTMALVAALDRGQLAGAGLDVLEEENSIREESELLSPEFHKKVDYKLLIADHVLLQRDDVIITPHNAFNSQESIQRILETTVQNIKAFLAGKPVNTVK